MVCVVCIFELGNTLHLPCRFCTLYSQSTPQNSWLYKLKSIIHSFRCMLIKRSGWCKLSALFYYVKVKEKGRSMKFFTPSVFACGKATLTEPVSLCLLCRHLPHIVRESSLGEGAIKPSSERKFPC